MMEGQVQAAGQPWMRRHGRAGQQHQARLDSVAGRRARAGRDGGGTRDQAPPGFFFGISPSHFFAHMRVSLAVVGGRQEIIGMVDILGLRVG